MNGICAGECSSRLASSTITLLLLPNGPTFALGGRGLMVLHHAFRRLFFPLQFFDECAGLAG